MNKLDILFVNPNNKKDTHGVTSQVLSAIEPPVWAMMKAGYARNTGLNVDVLDAEALGLSSDATVNYIVNKKPKLVDFVVMGLAPSVSSTPKMCIVDEMVSVLRKKGLKITLSGLHPMIFDTSITERFLEYPICTAWDLLPMTMYRSHNWHSFNDLNGRSPYASVYTSFGCPYKCNFCNVHMLYGGNKVRFRKPVDVVKELVFLNKQYGIRNIRFLDELFTLNHKHVDKICELLIDSGIDLNIWAYARIDSVNQLLLKKMFDAGVTWLGYGIESSNHSKSKFSNKIVYDVIKMTKDVGINIIGNFIFGLPDDTIISMQNTLNLAKGLNCEYANFYTFMAYPGCSLYNGNNKDWLSYAQLGKKAKSAGTNTISPGDVLRFRDDAFIEYYSNPVYLDMIHEKFGEDVVNHIGNMLKHSLVRDCL